MGSGQ